MKWTTKTPKYGDVIRVKVKFYYHYGIFVDETSVVQFGMPDNTGVNPDDIEVITTDVDVFRNGGSVETAVFSVSEKLRKNSNEKVVKTALSRLGEKGYNILHNNCEHFVNFCVFGEHESSFVNDVREEIRRKLNK
jgi:hypothetical protein